MKPPIVILCGGLGTRLGELTKDRPKPMVEVRGKPFLYWLIQEYRRQGFTHIEISTGYKAEVIETYPWPSNWEIVFNRDGPLCSPMNIYEQAQKDCWVVNGDTWICGDLPNVENPTIVTSLGGVDAGAQFPGPGKIHVHRVFGFYDIGTPQGLRDFVNARLLPATSSAQSSDSYNSAMFSQSTRDPSTD